MLKLRPFPVSSKLQKKFSEPFSQGWVTHRDECIRQMHVTDEMLKSYGATTRFVDIGEQVKIIYFQFNILNRQCTMVPN